MLAAVLRDGAVAVGAKGTRRVQPGCSAKDGLILNLIHGKLMYKDRNENRHLLDRHRRERLANIHSTAA